MDAENGAGMVVPLDSGALENVEALFDRKCDVFNDRAERNI